MSDTRGTLWSGNVLIDAFPRPRRPWVVAGCALGLLLLLDVTMTLALRTGDRNDVQTLSNPAAVRQVLASAAAVARDEATPVWLLMGDSVLVGSSVRETVSDWDQHRVIDYLRREVSRATPVRFYQTAMNGLLPTDLLQLVRELDRQDPAGRVGVVIEVNLRYFSPHYAEHAGCTRPWLERLAPPVVAGGRVDWATFARLETRHVAEHLRAATPVLRHRETLASLWDVSPWPAALAPARKPKTEDPMALLARVHEHFKTPVLRGEFPQLNAFREVIHRIAASGRPALLFTPPLSDAYIGDVTAPDRHAEDLGLLSRLIDREDGTQIRLVHLDHPIFDARMFQDIAHMYPPGNRLLALNLLHALNLPFATPPEEAELVYPEGPEASLLWNIESGNRDGAPWQAALQSPRGIALIGDRCVIADTGNHCLRVFDERMGTVRMLAGQAGTPGWVDGAADAALLEAPFAPVAVGEDLYFAEADGRRLRRLHQARVMTEGPLEGPGWSRIRALRTRDQRVYLLDGDATILEYDPATMTSRDVAPAAPWSRVTAFDLSPDGRLFVADAAGRIWLADLVVADRDAAAFDLFFENTAAQAIPDSGWYPFAFDEMRLDAVQDLRYVPRYNGLLVQDLIRGAKKLRDFDEGYHLRFLGLNDRRIYPWTMPIVSGGYVLRNAVAETWVSPFRAGSLALAAASSTLYYLEENRTRLFRMSDGLWTAAKIGHTGYRPDGDHAPDLFGPYSGAYAYYNHLPDRYLGDRVEGAVRTGPYLGMLVGPSIISASDVERNYSLGRALEQRLQRQLGLGAGARFDLIVRSEPGMDFIDAVERFVSFVELGGRLDTVFFTLRNIFDLPEGESPGAAFEAIARTAEHFDTRVVFIDANPLFSRYKDSLRPDTPSYRESRRFIEKAGFEVVDIGGELLRAAISNYPTGSPPFLAHHASPWAIDEAADLLAARLYPGLAKHLTDRIPALQRLGPLLDEPLETLRTVIEGFEATWGTMPTVPVPMNALQHRYADGHLRLLLDLNRVAAYRSGLSEAGIERIAWSVLRQALYGDLAGRLATTVSLRLATFANYDEYGAGVADSAEIVLRLDLDNVDLEAFLEHHLKTAAAAP